MRTNKKVSLREIARICNLSPATVSRIVNGTGSFSEETKQLVFDTMKREGYFIKEDEEKTEAFRKTVGCLVPDFSNEIFADRLMILTDFFAEKNIDLIVIPASVEEADLNNKIRLLYRLGVSGIISVVAWNYDFLPVNIPIICMDIPGVEIKNPNIYCVSSDEFVGGQLAAETLYRKGCTNPLILNIRYSQYSANQRILGFIKTYEKYGIQINPDRIIDPEYSKSSFLSAKDLVTYYKTKGVEFDSIFAASDWRAYGAIVALKDMGLSVPDDIKVIGYDGIRISRYCELPFTTIKQDTATITKTACNILWKLLNNETVEDHQILIPIYLQEGKTT